MRKGCLERQRQDIRTDGSRVEGSHKGWNSLQRVHTSGIVTFTGLCHDFVLRRNVRVAFSKVQKSDFVSSTHGSHHIHLIDKIAKLFNNFRLEEKATSTTYLPELKDIPSGEHFGLVTSGFASTYGGLLDIKTEDSDMTGSKFLEALSGDGDAVDLALLSARSEMLEELNIDPQLLSQPQAPLNTRPSLSCPPSTATVPIAEVADASKALAIVPTKKRKVDNIVSESEPKERPHKIVRPTTGPDAPLEVSASSSNQVSFLPILLYSIHAH